VQCLKCGREIPDRAVFCPSCLKGMEDYPIKPGTVIQLPTRPATPEKKAQKKREEPREIIARQRKLLQGLLGWIALLSLVILLLACILLYFITVFF